MRSDPRRHSLSISRLVTGAFFCAFFYHGAPAAAQVSGLTLSSGAGGPGTATSLALSFGMGSGTGGSAPSGLQWTLVYPPNQIAAIGVTAGPAAIAAGKTVSCAPAPGLFHC